MGRIYNTGSSAAPATGGGRIKWSPAPVPPPALSEMDQRVIKSFQTLPEANRKSTLDRLMSAANSGDTQARRKLSYLVPEAKKNLPATPDYQDKSLSGRAYQASRFLQDNAIEPSLSALLGSSHQTAGEEVVRHNGKVTQVKGGRQNTLTDQALDALKTRLMMGGPQGAAAVKAPLALLKAGGVGAAANSGVAALDQLNSGQRAGKSAKQVAIDVAGSIPSAAALGFGFGVAGKVGQFAAKGKPKAPQDVTQALQQRIGRNQLLTNLQVREGLKDTLDRAINAPTSVDPTTRTLLVNKKVLQGDLDHLAADKGIELPNGAILRRAKGESVQSVQGKYLDELVKFEESHVKNATIGDVQDLRAGKQTGRQFDERAIQASKRPAHQAAIEAAAAKGDMREVANIINRMPDSDPYKPSMISIFKDRVPEGSLKTSAIPLGPGVRPGEVKGELIAPVGNERGSLGNIKKPIDNTPAAQEFRNKIISGVPKEGKGKVATTLGKAKRELIDKYSPIRSLSQQYEKLTGKPLDIEQDPYKLARLHAGVSDLQKAKIDELGAIIREAPDVDALKEVGVATRILTDRSGIKNPISPEIAQQRLNELKEKLGPEGFAKTQEVVKKVIAYHDQTLKYLADNGIISKEAYGSIKANNQNYFSKFDVVDYLTENADGIRKGSSFNVAQQDLIKKQVGTEKAIADPIEATIRQTAKAIDLVERNKVGQAVYQMADNSGGLVMKLKGESVPAGYDKFSTFVDGKKVDLVVPKEVGESLKQLNRKQADVVTKSLSFFGNIFRKSATSLNVGFAAITNPIRDLQTFALNSKYVPVYKIPVAWGKGFAEAIKQGDLYREFLANKGGQSTFFNRGASQITETAKSVARGRVEQVGRTVINPKELFGLAPAIERLGQTFELAPRLGEYGAARKAGVSPLQAAFDARNVTVDFSQSGTTGQLLNQWVPFLNARLQGNIKNVEAIKRNPLRAAGLAGFMLAPAVVGTYIHNRTHFNDEYDSIPPYVKDNYFVIIYGKNRDEDGNLTDVVKIPKSDMGRIFGNPINEFMEFLYHKNPENLVQVALESGSAFSPVDFARNGKLDPALAISGIIPPAVKGIVENTANYSFFRGAPVVSESKAGLPAREQVYKSTSALAKAIGGATGYSPIKTDNLIRSVTTSATQQVTNPGGTLKSRLFGAPGNNVETLYYQNIDKLTPYKNSYNNRVNAAIAKGDIDEAKNIAGEFNRKVDDSLVSFYKQYGKQLTQEQRDGFDNLKFDLTSRSIKQRQAKLKKKS